MRTVTLEEHFSTAAFAQAAAAQGARPPASAYFRALQEKLLDLDGARLDDMDAAGIDVQVLSLAGGDLDRLESAAATALARDANDVLAAAVARHPGRFAAFAALNLREPENAAAEFERCVRQLGFRGALVNGTSGGLFLDHPRFEPVLATAQTLEAPIYLHPAPPPAPVRAAYFGDLPQELAFALSTAGWGWHAETGMHCLRLMATGVFDRFPGLQMIIGHMGEDLPFSLARADDVLARSAQRPQGALADVFRRHFHVTTSGYFTLPPFRCALSASTPLPIPGRCRCRRRCWRAPPRWPATCRHARPAAPIRWPRCARSGTATPDLGRPPVGRAVAELRSPATDARWRSGRLQVAA